MLRIPETLKSAFLQNANVDSRQSILQFNQARVAKYHELQKPVVVGLHFQEEYVEVMGCIVERKNDYMVIADKWEYIAINHKDVLFVELLENTQAVDSLRRS
ncbi:hypothetical protein KKF84_13185 [Myxococcota bacterium]|nr:hypothetical protein [Myxococcota bacterium]